MKQSYNSLNILNNLTPELLVELRSPNQRAGRPPKQNSVAHIVYKFLQTTDPYSWHSYNDIIIGVYLSSKIILKRTSLMTNALLLDKRGLIQRRNGMCRIIEGEKNPWDKEEGEDEAKYLDRGNKI